MDEPTAALSANEIDDLFRIVAQLKAEGRAIVFISHKFDEIFRIADRVAVMSKGRLLQAAPPQEIYRSPADAAVAGFVGRGSLVSGNSVGHSDRTSIIDIAGHRLTARSHENPAGPVKVLLRPEALRIADEGLPATVLDSVYRGPVHEVRLALGEPGQHLLVDSAEALAAGQRVHVAVSDAWVVPGS